MKESLNSMPSKLPSIDLIGQTMVTQIKKSIHELSKINNQWKDVPPDLMYGNNHSEQMERAYIRSIKVVVEEITKNWNSTEIKELIAFLSTANMTINMANSIHNEFSPILWTDFGPQINKNFSEMMMISSLPLFINGLKEKISKPKSTKILEAIGEVWDRVKKIF